MLQGEVRDLSKSEPGITNDRLPWGGRSSVNDLDSKAGTKGQTGAEVEVRMWSVQNDALGQGSLALTLMTALVQLTPLQADRSALKVALPTSGTDTPASELLNPLP